MKKKRKTATRKRDSGEKETKRRERKLTLDDEEGQAIIVGAIAIAIGIVVVAAILNGAVYSGNVASREAEVQSDSVIKYQHTVKQESMEFAQIINDKSTRKNWTFAEVNRSYKNFLENMTGRLQNVYPNHAVINITEMSRLRNAWRLGQNRTRPFSQPSEPLPLDVVIVVDDSGSMCEPARDPYNYPAGTRCPGGVVPNPESGEEPWDTRLYKAINASKAFVNLAKGNNTQISIVRYDKSASRAGVPGGGSSKLAFINDSKSPGPATWCSGYPTNSTCINQTLSNLEGDRNTNMERALEIAQSELLSSRTRDYHPNLTKLIIFMSDGRHNAYGTGSGANCPDPPNWKDKDGSCDQSDPIPVARNIAANTEIKVETVGIGTDQDDVNDTRFTNPCTLSDENCKWGALNGTAELTDGNYSFKNPKDLQDYFKTLFKKYNKKKEFLVTGVNTTRWMRFNIVEFNGNGAFEVEVVNRSTKELIWGLNITSNRTGTTKLYVENETHRVGGPNPPLETYDYSSVKIKGAPHSVPLKIDAKKDELNTQTMVRNATTGNMEPVDLHSELFENYPYTYTIQWRKGTNANGTYDILVDENASATFTCGGHPPPCTYDWNYTVGAIFQAGYKMSYTDSKISYNESVLLNITAPETVGGSTDASNLIPKFKYRPDKPHPGETVVFNASNSTEKDPNQNIISYQWDFDGDGTYDATGVNVTHQYSSAADYRATLKITNNIGETAKLVKKVPVTVKNNQAPNPDFTVNPSKYPNETQTTVKFNAAPSSDPDGSIASYEWDLDGDGKFDEGTGKTITNVYDKKYGGDDILVGLRVTDNKGEPERTTKKIHINDLPNPKFTVSPNQPNTSEKAIFDATSSSDSDGSILSYQWDFDGDGTYDATGANVTHTYSKEGNYSVTLKVVDNSPSPAGVNKTTKLVEVNDPPKANFTYSPKSPNKGQNVSFDASSSSDKGTITKYEWDWNGDGTYEETGETATHTFSSNGTYAVTLKVTDDDGATDTETRVVSVGSTNGPNASFTYSPKDPDKNQTVNFDGSGSTDNGTITKYEWDWDGDGTFEGSGEKPSHKFTSGGNHSVTLKVTDNSGLVGLATKKVHVNKDPTARFTYKPNSPSTGETVTLNASTSSDPDGSISSYVWEIDGKKAGAGKTITTSFANNGTHNVTLRVTDNDGASAENKKVITVTNKSPPVAKFRYTPTSPKKGDKVDFNASPSYDPDGAGIKSYKWKITSTSPPSHKTGSGKIYEATLGSATTYTVTLTVTDKDGLSATKTKNVTVGTAKSPTAKFTYSPNKPKKGETVTFDGSSSKAHGSNNVKWYAWDFNGDGSYEVNITSATTKHSFSSSGKKTVELKVTDNSGNSGTTTKTINVQSNKKPNASFTYSPSDPETGETVTFDASSSNDPDGSIKSYEWDLNGDGNYGDKTGVSVNMKYKNSGDKTVGLKVTDNSGATSTTTRTVTVKEVDNQPTQFSLSASDFDWWWYDYINVKWGFDDPDGVQSVQVKVIRDKNGQVVWTGSGSSGDESFRANKGSYTIVMTAIDNKGNKYNQTTTVDVN